MRPHLQSLIVASSVYQDKTTNGFVIAGTFNRMVVRQNSPDVAAEGSATTAPRQKKTIDQLSAAGSPCLYFSLTDIIGRVRCSIRYVYLVDNQVLFSTSFEIESKDRLATCEQKLPLPMLPVVGLGQYAIEFLANDEMIGSLRIMTVEDESKSGDVNNE